ncbi:putative TRP2-anthranilate synthase component I [Acaromyces ingoldii]|uniref:Putative TRP2-anthranilate synthase component I n=1 Tax=Acaromyces ingoldii TaxID=215250 RepID=A0A316YU97_9BASI|nr:putative TRP2-anthranilate synthase component I [Acaromyces ingoldii]PWN91603.1 putative TRP2-anthranilate synthase component I [Acaromyces ingoldii]
MNGGKMNGSAELTPSLAEVTSLLLGNAAKNIESQGNTVPVYMSMPADLLTPVMAYLRLSNGASDQKRSFLCESVQTGEKIGRYSFIGCDPYKTIRSGPGLDVEGDPLVAIQKELDQFKYVPLPALPKFTGGAMGYVAYDCVQYFEPRTARPGLKDAIGIPESVFMFCDSIIIFDHIYQSIKFVSHVHLRSAEGTSVLADDIAKLYSVAAEKVQRLYQSVAGSDVTPLPHQPPILKGQEAVSNVGKSGYESFVTSLRKNIVKGDIIQAVPSQRLARKTTLHPFNAYRHLRQINPSPYMFYIDAGDAKIVGASPETLCKVEGGKVSVHAIAGTIKRGKTAQEDDELAQELATSTKDRAEHVMLVDLARNDVSRVCDPRTTEVETFMRVERFSHVMHLTSRVTGMLRKGKTRFDALRSIFPAGTVSGAPKIRAIELVSDLEGEKRGVYAGAVGHIDFASEEMDVCIAIRTMTFTGTPEARTAYLQAGGGIVYDSVEEDEYVETINKLGANVRCLDQTEAFYLEQQQKQEQEQ